MSDDPVRVVEFLGKNGHRLAVRPDLVESIIGEDEGCTVVTKGDTHRVTATYDEAKAAIWPEADSSSRPAHAMDAQ